MNILGTNRSEMVDPHPRDSAYTNVGHTSRQDPRGNRPASQDRLRDSRSVLGTTEMSSVKKKVQSDGHLMASHVQNFSASSIIFRFTFLAVILGYKLKKISRILINIVTAVVLLLYRYESRLRREKIFLKFNAFFECRI